MDINKQPGISFDTIFLKDLVFSRTPNINNVDLDIRFNSKSTINEEKTKLFYELDCAIVDKNKSFDLKCCMIGLFSIIEGSENMDLNAFSKNNAPALMLPYIRELVTTTTIRAGLTPVIFPPINIVSLLENNNRK